MVKSKIVDSERTQIESYIFFSTEMRHNKDKDFIYRVYKFFAKCIDFFFG